MADSVAGDSSGVKSVRATSGRLHGMLVSSVDEESRAFLQARLARFAKICFLLSCGAFAFRAAYAAFGSPDAASAALFRWTTLIQIGGIGIFLACWTYCRGRARPARAVELFDALLLPAVLAALSLSTRSDDVAVDKPLTFVLAATNLLVFRSLLVPSPWLRTVLIGLFATAIVVTITLIDDALSTATGETADSSLRDAIVIQWCVVATVVSAVASQTIYSLQRRFDRARKLGQYTLEEKLGEGGMGMVYRARHAMLRRPTAIKLLRPQSTTEENISRFEREVQLTSRLNHPSTIAIYDYGRTPDGIFYYAMEYLPGIDLQALVRTFGTLPAGRAIHILEQICGSLHEAHAVGLIHRDIKPANVILCERGGLYDVAKVLDFGLVKDLSSGADPSLTEADVITGTPLYLSPEAIRTPQAIDARSDLYAVGALGHFLLCGKHLFDGDNALEICTHQLRTVPATPSARGGAAVAPDLEALIMRCLEKAPEARPQTARELQDLLLALRDAGSWTEADAQAWWDEHRQAIEMRRRGAAAAAPSQDERTGAGDYDDASETRVIDVSR